MNMQSRNHKINRNTLDTYLTFVYFTNCYKLQTVINVSQNTTRLRILHVHLVVKKKKKRTTKGKAQEFCLSPTSRGCTLNI